MQTQRLVWTVVAAERTIFATALGFVFIIRPNAEPLKSSRMSYTLTCDHLRMVGDVEHCTLGDYSGEDLARQAAEEWLEEQVRKLSLPTSTLGQAGAEAPLPAAQMLEPGLQAGLAFLTGVLPFLTSPQFVQIVPLTLAGQSCSVMLLNTRRRVGVRISEGTKPGMLEMTTGSEDALINWIGGSTTYFAKADLEEYAKIAAEGYLNS